MFKRFVKNERGTVSVMVAVLLPALLGFVALVAEFGNGLVVRTENQRVADLAAFAGATAFSTAAPEDAQDEMDAAVARIATLNGFDPADVTADPIDSPRGNGAQAVLVAVLTNQPLFLAPILGNNNALTIGASAAAEVASQEIGGCVFALGAHGSAISGVTLEGGTALNADQCTVASNSTVKVPCGTTITTTGVTYNSPSPPTVGCNGIRPPTGEQLTIAKAAAVDPLLGNAAVATATARLSAVSGISSPAGPIVTAATVPNGTVNLEFPYWQDTNWITNTFKGGSSSFKACGTATYNNSTWTIDCPYGATYNIGTFKVGSGLTIKFNWTGALADTVFNFKGAYNTEGTVIWPATRTTHNFASSVSVKGTNTFGAGKINANQGMTVAGTVVFNTTELNTAAGGIIVDNGGNASFNGIAGKYNIIGGLKTNGGSTTLFKAGTFNIGSGSSCSGANYSICHTGTTLTFNGSSSFVFPAGIYNTGGSTLSLGTGGTTNTYDIGASSGGNALVTGGGAKTTFADATGSVVKFAGNLSMNSGGGSCLTLPAASQHDIKGYVATAGGTLFGAGVYTVTGYVGFGINGGGDVSCNGDTIGVKAVDVTFVIGGGTKISSGTCSGSVFCVSAGYGNVNIDAPNSGTTDTFAVIGPISSTNTGGATIAHGASNTKISGSFYFPYGPIKMSGGAHLANGAGDCLEIIGASLTLSGGTTAGTTCVTAAEAAAGGGGGDRVVMLVQ